MMGKKSLQMVELVTHQVVQVLLTLRMAPMVT